MSKAKPKETEAQTVMDAMLDEIQAENVAVVIIKEISSVGIHTRIVAATYPPSKI